MSTDWITDRPPTEDDADINGWVYNELGLYTHWQDIQKGRAWMPIILPKPYVKPKRYIVKEYDNIGGYDVFQADGMRVAMCVPTREAAERIAAIYEEVLP